MGKWTGGRGGKRVERWVGTWTLEVRPDPIFELLKCGGFDVELPFQVGAHLALHLVDLPESKHTLTDDTPGLVGICIVADDLGSNHKCGDEQTVAGGTAGGDEPSLQSLQKVESSKGNRVDKSRSVESIGNEVSEIWVRIGRRGRLLGAMKEGVDVASAHLCGLFMAVEVVLLRGKELM